MPDVERPTRVDEVAIAKRRREVAALYLAHQTQTAIARLLNVGQSTISDDLAALKEEWRTESLADLQIVIEREANELDEMERRAAVADSKAKTPEWFDRRLKVKERRARLLGLDAPQRIDATSGGQVLGSEWQEVRQVMMSALLAFPEARAAVAERLLALEERSDPEGSDPE
ncbi:MAG TPA: hypothetical protein VGP44_08335 [Gemmatimonadales bacterium]|nr:hypothetical protein [Gemmatimonadales bacterium]